MSYGADELKSFDEAANSNRQFIASVNGKSLAGKKRFNKLKGFTALGFILGMVGILALLTLSGHYLPAIIHDSLAEEFDMQHADMVKSVEIVFQQTLKSGSIDENTAIKLKEKGILVGYLEADDFIEATENEGGLVMKFREKIITADDFINMMNNIEFYNAVAYSVPAFSRAAGYYDEAGRKVFQKIGTNRNNYTNKMEFDEVMEKNLGEGSDVKVNSVSLVKKTRRNERGQIEEYWEYEENGAPASPGGSAMDYIASVREKNPATNAKDSALFSADALMTADIVTTKERASLFYALFQENVSKMKAEEGNDARVNEAMDFLYESFCSDEVDVDTAEVVEECGSALEDPSLYAVLSKQRINPEDVKNSSSERVLKTVENQLGVESAGAALTETVVSSSKKRGAIGRFIGSGIEVASAALLDLVEPTISSSLINNSYQTIRGKKAGKLLVNGEIEVGEMLAKQSGGTVGDAQAIVRYARVNSQVIAMEKAADRMNRSPFDITSKNTFLGSILYNLAIGLRGSRSRLAFSSFSGIMNTVKQAAVSLMPKTYADEVATYLTSFGNCERFRLIGAEGTAECLNNITFDTTTYDDPLNDPGFVAFIENNTILEDGVRTIRRGSDLERFIIYNNERETPVGMIDGGILKSLENGSSSISFVSDILGMVTTFIETDESARRVASGAAFVNSSANPDWEINKYAQRYVSLARATSMLQQYSETAYRDIEFFEGEQNPVMALLEEYYASR